jgi:hypothetical protein
MKNTRTRDIIQRTNVEGRRSGGENCIQARVRRWLTELSLTTTRNGTHTDIKHNINEGLENITQHKLNLLRSSKKRHNALHQNNKRHLACALHASCSTG